jgi:hypothetical protein
MLRYALTAISVFVLLGVSFAQAHDNRWFFGGFASSTDTLFGGSVIDFSEEPPLVFKEDKTMNFDVTMASACDSSGQLQFYTNGIAIDDASNQTMANGDSLNPGQFATSFASSGYILIMSEIVLPLPGQPSKYALFHLKFETHPVFVFSISTLYMTVVDMSLNGGLGEVVSKNEVLLSNGRFGSINAVKHANGRDWWIWTTLGSENKYQRFLLTPSGLYGPDEIAADPAFCCPESEGTIAFSPDGTKMVRYNVAQGLIFYDFDRCSGTLSNPTEIPLPDSDWGGGIAFSQGSRYFYLAHDPENIYQYDTWAADIAATQQTVAAYDGFRGYYGTRSSFYMMQLGPDGRIYITAPNSIEVLGYIDQPDRPGPSCRVVQHGLHLPTMNHFTCPHYPYYRLGPLDGSPCDTLGLDNHPVAKFRYYQDSTDYLTVNFTDLSTYAPTGWSWSFGDGTVSQDTSPVHTFPQGGTYEVCLTVSNPYSSDIYCRTLQLGTSASGEVLPSVNLTVFPNPAREATNFILSDYLPCHATLYLHTATGQLVHTQRIGFGWNLVPLEGIAPGLYFYEVRDMDKVLKTGKLVVVE